jgi:hypothetical protein
VVHPAATDMSDNPFTVVVPPIVVYYPTEGSVVFNNNLAYVSWTLTVPEINLLNAELSTDNGQTFVPISQNINALAGYVYLNISADPSDSCILKLYNVADPTECGLSALFIKAQADHQRPA